MSHHRPSPKAPSVRELPLAHPSFGNHRPSTAAASRLDLPLADPAFSRLAARSAGLALAGTRPTVALSSLALARAAEAVAA